MFVIIAPIQIKDGYKDRSLAPVASNTQSRLLGT